jgi:Abnormal spindle-like microcephaly-assoc'd, ASPM-SPD-2-Hydin
MGKWFLRNWTSPQRVLTGTLTNVHDSGGTLDGGDNDTNLEIAPRPEPEFQELLKNRRIPAQVNGNGLIECEINVGSDWRSQFEFFVNSLVGREVTAQGVFVDDDGHDSKTELHPMDVIFARVDDSQLPGDWIGSLAARRGLVLDQSLFVTRFAAASDDREGLVLSGPPLASWDRPTTIALPLPPVPPGDGWVPDFSLQVLRQEKATVETAVVEDSHTGNLVVQVTITCQGRDYGGPGVAMGEIGTFWTSQILPAIQISPTHISFDKVTVRDVADRTVTITNTGHADLVITIAPPVQHAVFTWAPASGQAIVPGASVTVNVQFAPPGVGLAQGQLRVDSNAAGSPHIVRLEGTGVKGSIS